MDLIQITDLHVSKDKEADKHDCKPYERLAAVLEQIKEKYSEKCNLVITGDLSSDFTQKIRCRVYFLIAHADSSKSYRQSDQVSQRVIGWIF